MSARFNFSRPFLRWMVAAALVLASPFGQAGEARPLAEDPVAEKRLQAISAELRCLVCQNETIASSNADLAKDLRREIRAKIQAGQSDAQIIDFMVAHYGDFVLYRPPFKRVTFLLWLGPFLFLTLGFLLLRRYLERRNAALRASPPLSEAEARQAEALLAQPPRTAARTTPKTPS
jgi:cytochrome c-type biogenesis protein CcmH